jgi:hypothetical protein
MYQPITRTPSNSIICNSSQFVWFAAVIHISNVIIFSIQHKKTVFQNNCVSDVKVRTVNSIRNSWILSQNVVSSVLMNVYKIND